MISAETQDNSASAPEEITLKSAKSTQGDELPKMPRSTAYFIQLSGSTGVKIISRKMGLPRYLAAHLQMVMATQSCSQESSQESSFVGQEALRSGVRAPLQFPHSGEEGRRPRAALLAHLGCNCGGDLVATGVDCPQYQCVLAKQPGGRDRSSGPGVSTGFTLAPHST